MAGVGVGLVVGVHPGVPPLQVAAVSAARRRVFVVMQEGVCFRPVAALFLAAAPSLPLNGVHF